MCNDNVTIIKRNGKRQEYDELKPLNALKKANRSVKFADRMADEEINSAIDAITDQILLHAGIRECTVEEIQDMVVDQIAKLGKARLALAYANYRNEHEKRRAQNTTDAAIMGLVSRAPLLSSKDKAVNEEIMRENSNKNKTMISTQRDAIAGEVSKDLTFRRLLPDHIIRAHEEGILHFHDADYFLQRMANCCLINIGDMLDNGTVMNGKMIESPKSFQVACTVTTQIIANIASNQYGGQSIDIRHLGKYVAKSREKIRKRLSEELGDSVSEEVLAKVVENEVRQEIKSGVQTIQYQINTLMTTNGQSPFVTIFMYLREDDLYIKDNALIIEEILNQRLEGIKNECGVYVTPAFPKLVYVLDENNCLQGGEYDYLTKLAVKCSAKRMYPDYISAKKMRETYEGQVFSCMGCRSFLAPWKDENGEYKFEGRFNQGVVSINLPQIGLEVKGDMEKFWPELDRRLELCKEALMCRHNALLGTKSDFSPLHWQYGALARLGKGEVIDPYLYGGYSSISLGYIGLYELTYLMTGEPQTSPDGKEFALSVMKHLKETTERWRDETNIGFSLYGTPAESLCYRFAKIDRQKYGDVKNVTDKGYYTNSYHVDVREHIDAFSKFKLEAEFQPLSTGGCISYVEIPNMRHNLPALEELVKFIYDNIQYAEFNTKSDYCHVCGFDGEIIVNKDGEWECPQCHNKDHAKMNVTRRTCGYLGENFWNEGKTKEISSRVLHI